MLTWTEWQTEVVTLLNREFNELLRHVSLDDVDWPSWRSFFLEGRSPIAAFNRAFERDL